MHHSLRKYWRECYETQSFVSSNVCACARVCADHARWLVSGHTVSQTLNSNSFFHSFEAVCVYAAQGHWFVPDSRLLFTTLSQGGPNPISKFPLSSSSLQGENHLFFFPFAQPSWRVPGKQSCKSCNKNASVSIKQHRDKNRRLQILCLGQSLVETDCRAGGIITLCVKNTLGANKVAAYLNENTQRLEYADESRRGSGGDVCLWLCN